MRQFLVGLLAISCLSGPAMAQHYDWSGLYLGAHAGYGSGDFDVDLSHTTGAIIYSDPFAPDQRSLDSEGSWLGGFQVGANHQMGVWVVGIEADASWTDLEASGRHTTITTGPCAPNACTQWDIDTQIEALGTIRGRLGFVVGRTLFYGTGGLAWAITDASEKTHHNGPDFATPGAVVSGDSNHIGYTVGGGAELAIGGGWSLKGEYLFVDLGEAAYKLDGVTAPGSTTPWTESFNQDIQMHTARIGLNYNFYAEPERIGPLK